MLSRIQCLIRNGLFLTGLACGRADPEFVASDLEPGLLVLQDGRMVSELFGGSDSIVVSIYDPSDCLSCSTGIHAWRVWQTESRGRQHVLLFTRLPTEPERRQLAIGRTLTPHVLAPDKRLPAPISFLIVQGRAIDWARGKLGEEMMANRLRDLGALTLRGTSGRYPDGR